MVNDLQSIEQMIDAPQMSRECTFNKEDGTPSIVSSQIEATPDHRLGSDEDLNSDDQQCMSHIEDIMRPADELAYSQSRI